MLLPMCSDHITAEMGGISGWDYLLVPHELICSKKKAIEANWRHVQKQTLVWLCDVSPPLILSGWLERVVHSELCTLRIACCWFASIAIAAQHNPIDWQELKLQCSSSKLKHETVGSFGLAGLPIWIDKCTEETGNRFRHPGRRDGHWWAENAQFSSSGFQLALENIPTKLNHFRPKDAIIIKAYDVQLELSCHRHQPYGRCFPRVCFPHMNRN